MASTVTLALSLGRKRIVKMQQAIDRANVARH
jgi:hypothetical protein